MRENDYTNIEDMGIVIENNKISVGENGIKYQFDVEDVSTSSVQFTDSTKGVIAYCTKKGEIIIKEFIKEGLNFIFLEK